MQRYEAAREEAKRILVSGQLSAAEARYTELLRLAEEVRPGVYEVYANVVSPLADIYRKLDQDDKLEALYTHRVEIAARTHEDKLALGLAQADLGFFYQNSDVSADRFHGEGYVGQALRTFEQCSASKTTGEQCRRRLADTAGIQGAIYFQHLDYKRAEPLFRRVIGQPENMVQAEVLFVSLHALRGILMQRNQQAEAQALERRAAELEARNGEAVARLRNQSGTRSRSAAE